jgi:hypothetical protein
VRRSLFSYLFFGTFPIFWILRSPYAPCLLGFEGHAGNRTPTIRGIVVHQHNEELLREAHVEMASLFLEESHEKHQYEVYKRWKRLLVGVLTKARLERAYGADHDDDVDT